MNYNQHLNQKEWVRSLKIGDTVYCRVSGSNKTIKDIGPEYLAYGFPILEMLWWIIERSDFLYSVCSKVLFWPQFVWEKFALAIGIKYWHDAYLSFDDGTYAWAMGCCLPINDDYDGCMNVCECECENDVE